MSQPVQSSDGAAGCNGLEEEILSLSAFELQGFRRFEVHTFVRARMELRQVPEPRHLILAV